MVVKAYKVFNPDWTSKHGDTVFKVGKSYHQDGTIKCCDNGYHACTNLSDCFNYYSFDCNNNVAEVELSGIIDRAEDDTKVCASDITIVREIPWKEVLTICNTGNWNTGNRNTGNCNTGNCNTGNWNTGNRNTGNCNTGNWNTGNWNTGDCNTGNWNTGDWNTGFFNTIESNVFMFNKDTGMNRNEIHLPSFLYFDLTVWVSCDTATEEEMKEHKQDIETCGGFLKTLDYKEAFRLAWDKASKKEHKQVKNLPNFDPDIFYEISGIDLRENRKEHTK